MKRVAVFGNAGGGKSRLARRLAELTGLPLHVVDVLMFRPGGAAVRKDEFLKTHADIVAGDAWIIDGFGGVTPAWERFAAADTLIHVDLPLSRHYLGVTRRFLKGLFADPPGWPERSPLWSSTMAGYRTIPLCHRLMTPRYRQLIADAAGAKRVHHLRSPAEIDAFLLAVERERARRGA